VKVQKSVLQSFKRTICMRFDLVNFDSA